MVQLQPCKYSWKWHLVLSSYLKVIIFGITYSYWGDYIILRRSTNTDYLYLLSISLLFYILYYLYLYFADLQTPMANFSTFCKHLPTKASKFLRLKTNLLESFLKKIWVAFMKINFKTRWCAKKKWKAQPTKDSK